MRRPSRDADVRLARRGAGSVSTPPASGAPRGRCYTYVFPAAWEDHCKIGFSRDPLSRLQQLHRRWFEFFDVDAAMLVGTETVRDARDLELALRRPLAAHNAPAPLTVRAEAAGHTEWFRGVAAPLAAAVEALRARGYVVHALRPWARDALLARADQLYDWTQAQLSADELDGVAGTTPVQRLVRDVVDGYVALGIDPQPLLPEAVWAWYRRGAP